MRKLHWQRNMALSAVILVSAATHAVASPILYRDFSADTPGGHPSPNDGSTLSEYGQVQVVVVDSGSTPADPFGGVGNHSLAFTTESTGVQGQYVMAAAYADAIAQGVASLQFYHESAGNPLTELVLGRFDAFPGTSQTGPWLAINGDASILIFTSNGTITLDQAVSFDTRHDIAIAFDATTATFTASLDGTPLTAGATTAFPFYSSVPDINAWSVAAPSSSRSGNVFIDDVTIDGVPEPVSLGLGLSMLAARRRR